MTSTISTQTAIDIAAIVNQQRQDADELTPISRADLVSALQSAYLAQGITDVTEEMIEKGIDTYYSDRHQFQGFQGGLLSRWAGIAYLQIFERRRLIAGFLIAAVVVGASFSTIQGKIDDSRNLSVVREFENISKEMKRVNAEVPKILAQREAWLDKAKQNKPVLAQKSYDGVLGQYAQRLKDSYASYADINDKIGKNFKQPSVADVAENPAKFKNDSSSLTAYTIALQAVFMTQSTELDSFQRQAESITFAEQSYNEAVAKSGYASVKDDGEVERYRADAEKALVAGSKKETMDALSKLNSVVVSRLQAKELIVSAQRLSQTYATTFNYDESRSISEALIAQAEYAAQKGDTAGLKEASNQLSLLKDQEAQAAMNLIIRVVDRPDVMSGTARVFDSTQNKRFYLIVEAVNKAGIAMNRLIYNQETKKTESVPYWGQEVDEETFRKVGADKKLDGIVDDRLFGHKPAGTYSPIFDRPVLKGTITRW